MGETRKEEIDECKKVLQTPITIRRKDLGGMNFLTICFGEVRFIERPKFTRDFRHFSLYWVSEHFDTVFVRLESTYVKKDIQNCGVWTVSSLRHVLNPFCSILNYSVRDGR